MIYNKEIPEITQATKRDDRSTLEARDVLRKIREGIPIENAIVIEDIIYFDDPNLINHDVKISNCIFKGNVRLEALIFKGKVNISHSFFCQKLSFIGSHFEKNAYFSKIFEGEVDFSGSIFDKEASFSNSHFKGAVFFSRRVNDEFRYAIFKDSSEFMDSQFQSLDFERVRFDGDVYFRGSQFEGILDINSAYFKNNIEFDTINTGRAQFKQGCKIRLNDANFHRLMIHWNDLKSYLEAEDPSDLNALVKNYGNLGWFDDADNCYLAYKKKLIYNDYLIFLTPISNFKSRYINSKKFVFKSIMNSSVMRCLVGSHIYVSITDKIQDLGKSILASAKIFFHFLSLVLYGHGVRLIWPFSFGLFLLLLSAFIYHYAGQVGSIEEGIKISAKILVATTQVGNTTKVASLTGFCEWWSIIERFLGWLVMTTSVVVLAKKALR